MHWAGPWAGQIVGGADINAVEVGATAHKPIYSYVIRSHQSEVIAIIL